ncbi:MAG: ArnT family glycosyltransferase [Flavobacteriaceae bacterium]
MMSKKFILFLSLAALMLISGIGSWGLTESSEARYAEISKEMFDRQDYVNPTLLGIKHFHKPPVTYYLTMVGYTLFGTNEFGARFFLQIAFLIQLILIYKLSLLLFKKEKIGLWAAFIYFTLPLALISVRNLTTDAYLNTFILAAVYSYVKFREVNQYKFLYLFFALLGLIFETKGPVGWLIPIVFIIGLRGKFKFSIHTVLGMFLMLLISASWYIMVALRNPELLDYFINHQLVDRVANDSFSRAKPFWYYFAFAPLLGFPWLILLITKAKTTSKSLWHYSNYTKALLIAMGVFFIILSLSKSKLPLYVLPLYPFIAICAAYLYSEVFKRSYNQLNYIFGVVLCLGLMVLPFLKLNITIPKIQALIIAILGIGILSISYFRGEFLKKEQTLLLGIINSCLILVVFIVVFNHNESELNSPKPMAEFILKEHQDAKVVVFNELLPSVSFYLDRMIVTVNNGKYTTQRETQFESNKDYTRYLIDYKTEESRLNDILKENTVLIIKKKNKLKPNFAKSFSHEKVFGKYSLLYN